MTTDEILALLDGVKRSGDGWMAFCPAHKDRNRSLSVKATDDGRTLLHCFAGCTSDGIVDAMGCEMKDLFAENGTRGGRRWRQEDADHALAQRGLRRETIEHFRIVPDLEKQAWAFPLGARRPTKYKAFQAGNGRPKYWSQKGAKLSTYHLAPCVRARDAWLVEGEPDVWICHQAGVLAFSLTGGAENPPKAALVQAISDAKIGTVHIVYDRDDRGRSGAAKVAAALRAAGQAVTVHQLPTSVGPSGDVTTLYNNLGGEDGAFREAIELLPMVEDAPVGTPPPTAGGLEPSVPASPADGPQALTRNDTENAARLVARHGDRLHYIAPWGRWLVWSREEGRWVLDYRDIGVRELAKDVGCDLKETAAGEPDADVAKKLFAFALKSLDSHGISGMVNLARGIEGIPLDHEALDRDGWLLGVANGVIDLHSGTLRPADPADLMTMRCPVVWDEDAGAPRWEQAMEEWFPDSEVRAYVQRVAGSALVGAQRDHVFTIHYGSGRNGKGTFVRAITRALGPYGVVIHLSLLVEQKYKEHDTVRAALFRTRLAVASETQRRVKLDEASVKNLTGGDRITARRMREDLWEFDPTHSLWLQTNYLPEIAGRDRGIWSRIWVVKWEATFSDDDQDKDLGETLAGEAPGIIRWLVEGCLEWQQHGLAEPEAVIRETLAYRRAEDVLGRFASDIGLVFDRNLEIPAGELQRLLAEWATGEGIDPPRQEIAAWLAEHGARQKQRREIGPDGTTRRPRYWLGAGIGADEPNGGQIDALA